MRRKYNWDLLKRGAEAWHNIAFDGKFSVNVGDASGTLFKWESPGFSSHGTRMAGASLSKWPAATMLVGLVADGTLSFDDLASKHLSWWTTNSSDPRSRVKLRHLLSFTSGYLEDADVKCANSDFGFERCAEASRCLLSFCFRIGDTD